MIFLDHTQRRTTVGRTLLDEWSAGRRDLYLTTHDTHNRQISMPAAARLLRLWVWIPPGAWKFVCCECRVLSGRDLSDELITRPEESYRLCCVVVCDLETSRTGAPYIYIYGISSLRVKIMRWEVSRKSVICEEILWRLQRKRNALVLISSVLLDGLRPSLMLTRNLRAPGPVKYPDNFM
jgi:hypothetical protein